MESQQQTEPTALGPYRFLGMPGAEEHTDDARRRIARDDRTGGVALLMLPHEELADDLGYRVRFRSEAENSRRMTGFWEAPVIDVGPPDASLPWVAYACLPALSLPSALAAHDGPLSESTVRALGAVLADSLAHWHASGLVHAGISPGATFLMADGPRLTGYGLARAAALAGSCGPRPYGIDPFSLPPEQAAGERPRPEGDVYALAAVLCYAATGRRDLTDETRALMPGGLGDLIVACLSHEPGQRPQPAALARSLRASSARDTANSLPRTVVAAIGEQAAECSAKAPGSPPGPFDESPSEEARATARPRPSRRAVLIGALSGAGGLALGAGGVAGWRAAGEESGPRRTAMLRGTAPAPLWRYDFGSELDRAELPRRGMTALVATAESVTALNLRSGRKIWSRNDLYPMDPLTLLGNGMFLSPDTTAFSGVSLATGRIRWVERRYSGVEKPMIYQTLGADGDTVWFKIKKYTDGDLSGSDHALVRYDCGKRKEVWRTPLPAPYRAEGSDQPDGPPSAFLLNTMLLLPAYDDEGEETGSFMALDRRTGRKQWSRTYRGAKSDSDEARLVVPGNLLIFCGDDGIRAHDIHSGKERWRIGTEGSSPGSPVAHGRSVYVTDRNAVTHAVDVRSGRLRWRRRSSIPTGSTWLTSQTAVSHSGDTVFQVTDSEIEALDAADGSLRWRFAPTGKGQTAAVPGLVVGSTPGRVFILNGQNLYALPVD
ncbi:PQQ-binding-like beta-propeller repeat protein [Streptomyces sp. NPDC007983]|uniref:outer membrane protein assembly factor BamB family protein n=1 Tax=Streptomyces sp. NPDC007983 TaxID=3364800 RepID=UPI0036F18124